MSTTAVLRSEWIKMRSLRSVAGSLIAVLGVTLAVTLLAFSTVSQSEAAHAGVDPVFGAFYALSFGQIAAISFGATALSAEYLNGALRISLAAVPRRSLLYAAKIAVVGAPALAVGLVSSFSTFFLGQAFMGKYAIDLGEPGALRAAFGGGIYLALMALLAAGLTVLLRSAVAVLSLLIPFVLIVSFVIGDASSGVAQFLPDKAGQLVLHQNPEAVLDRGVDSQWQRPGPLPRCWRAGGRSGAGTRRTLPRYGCGSPRLQCGSERLKVSQSSRRGADCQCRAVYWRHDHRTSSPPHRRDAHLGLPHGAHPVWLGSQRARIPHGVAARGRRSLGRRRGAETGAPGPVPS